MAAPSMTFNAPGNIRTSASLAASTTSTGYNVDYSTKLEGQVTVKNTPGTVAATAGCRVDVYPRYGSGPADSNITVLTYTIPSVTSTVASKTFYLGTGKYVIYVTNLDATNAITVEITGDTVDGIA
jgi:hypothetical protein